MRARAQIQPIDTSLSSNNAAVLRTPPTPARAIRNLGEFVWIFCSSSKTKIMFYKTGMRTPASPSNDLVLSPSRATSSRSAFSSWYQWFNFKNIFFLKILSFYSLIGLLLCRHAVMQVILQLLLLLLQHCLLVQHLLKVCLFSFFFLRPKFNKSLFHRSIVCR